VSNNNLALNQAVELVSKYAMVHLPGNDDNEQVMYVNHAKVLVRTTSSRNSCICYELFHEGLRNKWMRSWGLTSDATWLLQVDMYGCHWWFNMTRLKASVTDGIAKGKLELHNNSQQTRRTHGSASNVMTVWLNKQEYCDYVSNHLHTDYGVFLQGVNGVTL
jgi:hypothetical protein